MCLMGLPMNLLWSSAQQELKQGFSNFPTVANATVSLSAFTSKPNKSLHIYVSCYSRLHYAATDKMTNENTDPMRIFHFMASISNMSIADKIVKWVKEAPRPPLDAFEKVLTLEGGIQLAVGVHLGRSFQVMQVSTDEHESCSQDGLDGCVC